MYRKHWQGLRGRDKRLFALRVMASLLSFIIGCGIIFNLRSQVLGENGSSLAIYFLGSLFILLTNLSIFGGALSRPESFALKLCIAAVLLAGGWVNFEEKVVLPMIASDCQADCVLVYERTIPFSEAALIYHDERGWHVLD